MRLRTHLIIPDTQVKPDVPLDHLGWVGQYIVDKFKGSDLAVIHLGDHWDMPSLSSWDKGKIQMEGRRYLADVEAGNRGMEILSEPLETYNARMRRTSHHERQWKPQRYLLRGNHEDRITRAVESDAHLEGLLSLDHLLSPGWEVVPFLEVLELDGIAYSHYFYNPMTGRPYSGTIENRLKQIGRSFTMGHQQELMSTGRTVAGRRQRGLICGACYMHVEGYKGPQGNDHWRGIVVCHEVSEGSYDLMEVSLDYLCRKYEGVSLAKFTAKKF